MPNKQSAGGRQAIWMKKRTTEDGNDEDNNSEYNDEMNRTQKKIWERKICLVHAAVAEAGQRTGMGDNAEIDGKTLFSKAYYLHKIPMYEKKEERK